jgi:hypothetical protein
VRRSKLAKFQDEIASAGMEVVLIYLHAREVFEKAPF